MGRFRFKLMHPPVQMLLFWGTVWNRESTQWGTALHGTFSFQLSWRGLFLTILNVSGGTPNDNPSPISGVKGHSDSGSQESRSYLGSLLVGKTWHFLACSKCTFLMKCDSYEQKYWFFHVLFLSSAHQTTIAVGTCHRSSPMTQPGRCVPIQWAWGLPAASLTLFTKLQMSTVGKQDELIRSPFILGFEGSCSLSFPSSNY